MRCCVIRYRDVEIVQVEQVVDMYVVDIPWHILVVGGYLVAKIAIKFEIAEGLGTQCCGEVVWVDVFC